MNSSYIEKFKTKNFTIGSFDSYQYLSKELMKRNFNLSDEEAEEIMKGMPTNYRASIVDNTGLYRGFIGLFNVDQENEIASLRFELNKTYDGEEKEEILLAYKDWVKNSLNINNFDEEIYASPEEKEISKNYLEEKSNIIIPSKMLVPGVEDEILEKYKEEYNIPKLQIPFTIKSNDKVLGIVGLSSLIRSNKRANLNIFLNKDLGEDIVNELSGYIIDDYINYVHNLNVHNVTLSVAGSDKNMLEILKNTNMNYYGYIPFGAAANNDVESNMMFQHIPYMKRDSGILVPENIKENIELLDTDKNELDKIIDLEDGYRLVSPNAFEEEKIKKEKIINGHIEAMKNRDNFTIPLGEDKYILQKGNGNYGLSKAVMNFNYVLLDKDNNYSGYINILRENANNKNAEIEIGIDPKVQNRGLGTKVINAFYDELFSVGYASVTSAVFDFNNPSIKLHDKVAQLNGIRLESYYINGKLHDMNYYTKVNDMLDNREIITEKNSIKR